MNAPQHLHDPLSGVVVVVLANFLRQHRGWGWLRLVAGASPFKNVPGLTSVKVMGSGHGGGFSLRPSATHQGLICTLTNLDLAQQFLNSAWVQSYRDRASEFWCGVLRVDSSRGYWDKQAWLTTTPEALGGQVETEGPLAVLTRASILPSKAMAFWRYAPAAQADLNESEGCLLSMGLGEAPLVRQCTFSLWQDTAAMTNFAHTGAHQLASAAAYKHEFFSECMFVRMRVLQMSGDWQGQHFGSPETKAPVAASPMHVQCAWPLHPLEPSHA